MLKNFHWGHGIIIALASFMIFILSMIVFFPMGKDGAEMVTDNYYEEELLYQDVIDAKNRADTLKLKPIYAQSKEGIRITLPENINKDNAKVKFDLKRTNDRNLDVKKDVELDQNNGFLIPASVLTLGNYVLHLSWTKDKADYRIDYDVIWK